MASPNTIKVKTDIAARAAVVRAATEEKFAETHPSLPRKSHRWMGRTKGLPFSRMVLKHIVHGVVGRPAQLVLTHPTRGSRAVRMATPDLLRVFFPSLPPEMSAAMLGMEIRA